MSLKEKFSSLPTSLRLCIFASLLIIGILLLIFGGGGSGTDSGFDSGEIEKYRRELEGEIKELCAGVRGAGEVQIAVSLSGGFEYVYATDKNGKIVTSGTSSSGVIIKRKLPEIAGVGVVCSGGGDPSVKNQLISLISAAYGIGTNRIFVAEAKK